MLSHMLALHPEVASLSEFLTSVATPVSEAIAYERAALNGPALWRPLCTPQYHHRLWIKLIQRGLGIDEFRYPLSRLDRHVKSGIPPLLTMTLPALSDDPDALHKELGGYVRSLPKSELGAHFFRIFDWLTERTGKRLWVERSGGSLSLLPSLMKMFPNAKFVHLWRDPRETALSASKFHPIRIERIAGDFRKFVGQSLYDVIPPANVGKLPELYRRLVRPGFDVDAYLRISIPIEHFAAAQSSMLCAGLPRLAKLPPERLLHMRYESVLENPAHELHRFIEFLDPSLERDAWVKQATALVRPSSPKWTQLPDDERARLDAECSPGYAALAELGLR
jgi:putative sulfotransferase